MIFEGKEYLTKEEVAALFRADKRTIERWYADSGVGFPTPYKVGRSAVIFKRSELDEWVSTKKMVLKQSAGE